MNKNQKCVVLNGYASEWSAVTSGAPHGSMLGLLMFLLSVNNDRLK